jgi:hypothetical protein
MLRGIPDRVGCPFTVPVSRCETPKQQDRNPEEGIPASPAAAASPIDSAVTAAPEGPPVAIPR